MILSLEQQQEAQLRRYDRERRVRLIRLFAPSQIVSAVLGSGVFLVIALHGTIPFLTVPVSAAIFSGDLSLAGCYWLAYLLAGQDRPNHAAALVVGSTAVNIFVVQTIYVINDHFGSIAWMLFVADGVLIMISAAIGTRTMVIGIAIICALYMGVLLPSYYLINGSDTTPHHELLGTILTGVLILLAMAFYTILLQNGFYRMARDTANIMSITIERGRQLDKLKDRFIINVNHELRNPMMAMMGNLDTLDRAWPKLDDEARLQFVRSALLSGTNVKTLLESILDIRRIEVADQFVPTAVDIRASIDQATRLIAPGDGDLVQRDLHVVIPPGLTVWGDALRLQQIFTNLLSNAIKYSAPGTAIAVQAQHVTAPSHKQSPQPPMVEITVRDSGFGIPPQQIPLLFQRFVRLERDLASTVTGNGLGLYLCREFTHAMQGEIWVESTGIAGEGSTFHLLLPASAPSPAVERSLVAGTPVERD